MNSIGKNGNMLLYDFLGRLDAYLNSALYKDYCPNGLQVEGKKELQKVATAVSANEQTLEAAVEAGVDALVVHHGLFWNRDPYPVVGSKRRKLKLLLDHQISLLAYHLPLDGHQTVGNNWKAARDMGWENLEPFGELNGAAIGVRGTVSSESVPVFIQKVEAYYGHSAAKALGGGETIRQAALISGGAYRELATAAAAGLDCFITGNFDEPAWGVAHEEGIHFLALGHSATERVGPKALADYINREWNVKSLFLDIENPF